VEPCGRWLVALLTQCWQQLMVLYRSIPEVARKCYCLIHQVFHNMRGNGFNTVEEICTTSLLPWFVG